MGFTDQAWMPAKPQLGLGWEWKGTSSQMVELVGDYMSAMFKQVEPDSPSTLMEGGFSQTF